MGRRWFGCFSLLVLGISGCWWDDLTSGSKNVVSNRSNVPPIEVLQKAPNDVGSRVDSLGKQILAANQDIGRTLVTADPQLQKAAAAKQDFRPVFFAYGVPDVVLFHQGFSAIVISDGLVRQCKSDSELAAVLSSELAAMVAEAQAQISARRQEIPDRQPPFFEPIGANAGGQNLDQSVLAEQAMYEQRNPRSNSSRPVVLDANLLAKSYMTALGKSCVPDGGGAYVPDDVAKVAPLVRLGQGNPIYNRSANSPRGDILKISDSPR